MSKHANADLVLASFSGGSFGATNVNQTNSFNIVVGPQDVFISQLGFFDHNADGLLASHEVGVWNSSGTLVTSAIVPSGTSAQLVGQWRMVEIASIRLKSAETYLIGAQVFGDRYVFNGENGVYDDAVGPVSPGGSLTNGSGLNFPTNPTGGRFNANATISAVPEPSSFVLLVATSCVVFGKRRRR
ncbi:DUF4082 domain-containing protein [Stieleria sp. JC731]|nr:PEP-CTERM sorting domain-containing protein [Stieleria sp. JC731]MCC9602271.1 DUF4082 domain-containing protein [Stieleria sp. JC731]